MASDIWRCENAKKSIKISLSGIYWTNVEGVVFFGVGARFDRKTISIDSLFTMVTPNGKDSGDVYTFKCQSKQNQNLTNKGRNYVSISNISCNEFQFEKWVRFIATRSKNVKYMSLKKKRKVKFIKMISD